MNDPQSLFIVVFTLVVVAAVLLIYGLSNKDSGGFIGKLQAWSTKQQAGSRQASNESLKAKLDGETLEAEHDNTTRLKAAQTQAGIAQAKAAEQGAWLDTDLIARAQAKGLDVQTYLSLIQKEEFNRLDLEKEVGLIQEKVRYALIAKHFGDHQMISMLNEQLDNLYVQINDIENSNLPDRVKERQIQIREEYAETLLGDVRGRQTRLLEAHNGGDVRGLDPDTEL